MAELVVSNVTFYFYYLWMLIARGCADDSGMIYSESEEHESGACLLGTVAVRSWGRRSIDDTRRPPDWKRGSGSGCEAVVGKTD